MDNSNGMTGASSAPADAARRIKDSTETVIDRGKQAASDAATEGATRIADSAQGAVSALRRAAADVEGDNRMIGAALRKGADSIERATQSFEGGDFSRAIEDLNGFARRQPALFLGASLALGFGLARVGKTAIEQSSSGPPGDDARSSISER
jgi:hypothetical protein